MIVKFCTFKRSPRFARRPFRSVQNLINIVKNIELHFDPPQIYNLLSDSINSGIPVSSVFIEHFQPVTPFHFDFIGLLKKHSNYSFIPKFNILKTNDAVYHNFIVKV